MRSRGWGARDGVSDHIKGDTRELTFLFSLPCDSKNTAVCKPERAPLESDHADLGLPAFKTVRK